MTRSSKKYLINYGIYLVRFLPQPPVRVMGDWKFHILRKKFEEQNGSKVEVYSPSVARPKLVSGMVFIVKIIQPNMGKTGNTTEIRIFAQCNGKLDELVNNEQDQTV